MNRKKEKKKEKRTPTPGEEIKNTSVMRMGKASLYLSVIYLGHFVIYWT